ncbi:hypothetical protein U9M48_023416, partial [Paspalum notatum var. saurae]
MDRQWMFKDRRSVEFIVVLGVFIQTTKKNKKPSGFISCPYFNCKNEKEYSLSKPLHDHLIRRGFMPGYNEEEEEEDKGNIDFTQFNSFADTLMGDADDKDSTGALAQMLYDAKEDSDNERDCKKLELLIKKLLPEGILPATTYEAKEVICPLGLEAQKYMHVQMIVSSTVCVKHHGRSNEMTLGTLRGNLRGRECLLRNKAHAKIIQWHKEERKKDDMLRHPADGSTYPNFAEDARNMRFGLSTDGMNLFSEMSSSHSTWPCLKQKFIMMPALSGNDIDVYLQTLVEELILLWNEGVRVWDAHKQEAFDLRALLFVTINDWPALANLSEQSNKGFRACVHCLDETDSTFLKHYRKVVYVGGHRRLLGGKHPGPSSVPVPNENGKAPMWKKKCIFWDLPYWEVLDIRHAIDMMHVTKSLCVNLLGFLGMYGKNKDTLEARKDMAALKGEQGHHYLGTASYTLSKREKESMFEWLDSMKVPSRYSSNVRRIIKCKDKKFVNLKSHDCHVLMTQLLPVMLRGILLENVKKTITKLCAFLNAISQKRYMAVLKKYVRNRSRPEGCIAKGYGTEEVIEFCTDYIDEFKLIGVPLSCYEGRL